MQHILLITFLYSVLFYLIGSIPTAYLVLKFSHKLDITKAGTGNVGAMNSYEVTGSKKIGWFVFMLDFLKGLIPAVIFLYVLKIDFEKIYIPLAALIAGHNFSVWLKFKGGRGLATSAGILFAVNFWLVIIWCIIYEITYLIKKDIHLGNIAATILLPVLLIIINSKWSNLINHNSINSTDIVIFCLIACVLILLKHISPIVSLIKR